MPSTIATIRILDMPEFKAAMAEINAELDRLHAALAEAERERDEWEERYEWLLGEVGGVSPG